MKTVYLHIGMPKTGTKSLQKFLTVNKQALKKRGYACPKVPIKYESATEWKNAMGIISHSIYYVAFYIS